MIEFFRGRRTPEPAAPHARIRAITEKQAPAAYVCVGRSNKRPPRRPVFKQALIRLQHGEQLPVIIRDLSAGGCRLEYSRHIRPSGRVLLNEPSLPISLWADIAWRADGACGLRFDRRPATTTPGEASQTSRPGG